jgi:hypothetical protein
MTRDEEELLVEQVAGAYRPRSLDELRYHPAWHDLDPAARQRAFDLARSSRPLEAALDPEGLSTTARCVLEKIVSSGTQR